MIRPSLYSLFALALLLHLNSASVTAAADTTHRQGPPLLFIGGAISVDFVETKSFGIPVGLGFGKTVKVPTGSSATILLPGRRMLTLIPSKNLYGELTLGPEPQDGTPLTFTLRSGVLAFDVRYNFQDPEGICLVVPNGRMTLTEVRGIVKVEGSTVTIGMRNGGMTLTSASGHLVPLESNQATEWSATSAPIPLKAVEWPAHLSTFGLDENSTIVATRILAGQPWDSSTSGAGFVNILVYIGILLYLGHGVQPRTGGKGAVPYLAFAILETQFSLSRFWVGVAGVQLPLGALCLGFLVALWSNSEERFRREAVDPGTALFQHLAKYLGMLAACGAASLGLRYFSLYGPGSFLTTLRTVIDPTGGMLFTRMVPAVPDIFVGELAAAIVALLLYRLTK